MNESYIIRPETERDYDKIYHLIKTAFETAKVSDGDEQDFAVNLRNSDKYIPELALVAERDNDLTGHVMFTRFNVMQTNGEKFKALLVAPLSVALEHRNAGIGTALINEGFRIGRLAGYTAAFLCGDPAYYYRFGFRSTEDFNIRNINNIPSKFSMVCELFPDALKNINGTIDFH
ncbi:MAG: GNAT family N-acetyltransferase [Dysgonomonas sp.]